MINSVFSCKHADDVLRAVKDHEIAFIQLWFVDILGSLKSFQITPVELERVLEQGIGFDASSIDGFARIDDADMLAIPDVSTFQVCAWRPSERPVARMFCTIEQMDGSGYTADSRGILQKTLSKIAEKGLSFMVAPELEFFLFQDDKDAVPLDMGGYFDVAPRDMGNNVRRDIIFSLERMGIGVEYSHHEAAPSQHEIDLHCAEALVMADALMTSRVIIKEAARCANCYASFMPKPLFGEKGSSLHLHQSLFKNGKNLFYDANDEYKLSADGKKYIAGIIHYSPEYMCITNQWINSYKRLVSGFDVPLQATWAKKDPSALVRVPSRLSKKDPQTFIEFRAGDPALNPYLSFAILLSAGLKGIEENMSLPEALEKASNRDSYTFLPDNLSEAVSLFSESEFMKEVFGKDLHEKICKNKRQEWDEYRRHITSFELRRYLPIL